MFKKKEDRPASEGDKKVLKSGAYFLGISAIFLVAVVIINLIVWALPSTKTTFDLTSSKLYSIGDTSKGVLATLDKDMTLYFLTENGSEDSNTELLLQNYAAA